MFTKEELELLYKALDSHTSKWTIHKPGEPAIVLQQKIQGLLKNMGSGPYRALAVQSEADPDTDWIDDGGELRELIDQQLITKANTLASMRELLSSLVKQRDQTMARLEGLKDVDAIHRENDRLKLELETMGPPEAKEEIEILTRKIASIAGERDVLKRQVDSLKTALRAERIDRMVDERIKPDVDPTLPQLPAATRPCPHEFDYTKCELCSDPLRLPAGDSDD